jgi:glyoxylase-like metal-dependent hydrolase (beta-lactamase superfamily II)
MKIFYPPGAKHTDWARFVGLPWEASRGGKATLFPEFLPTLRDMLRANSTGAAASASTGANEAARSNAPAARPRALAPSQSFDIRALQVQGFNSTNIYMLAGAGANIAVQIGDDGVVDTGLATAGDAVLAAIRRLSDKPIKYIINTHAHRDHAGGNAAFINASGGQRTDSGPAVELRQNPNGVFVIAHENTVDRMLHPRADGTKYPESAVARSSFTLDRQMYFNNEAIELWWRPKAHTGGDVLVFFRRSDVIVAGDLVQTDVFPRFEKSEGGRLQGIINGMNHIIDLAVPEFNQSGGTRIIPGHGRVCTESDIVELRDVATIARDRDESKWQPGPCVIDPPLTPTKSDVR